MRSGRLQQAFESLKRAISEVESSLQEMHADRDPLVAYIFTARRGYREMSDTKSGKRHQNAALVTWQHARELGFNGSLDEWR